MIKLPKDQLQALIAKNAAALLDELCSDHSFVVNLGVGIPLLAVNYLPRDNIYIHTENGMVGVGPLAYGDQVHPDLVNAGRQPVTETIGCSYTDASESFGMIRGRHIHAAVLGAFQVDQQANIANWIIPGSTLLGVGGAMDLVAGAQTVIIAMTHCNAGKPKLVHQCSLPITAYHEADYVVTEFGLFHFVDGTPILEKIHPELSVQDVRNATEFDFSVADQLSHTLLL